MLYGTETPGAQMSRRTFNQAAEAMKGRVLVKRKKESALVWVQTCVSVKEGQKFKPVNPILWTWSQLTLDYPSLRNSCHSALQRLILAWGSVCVKDYVPTCRPPWRPSPHALRTAPGPRVSGRGRGLGAPCRCVGMMMIAKLRRNSSSFLRCL